MSNTYWVYILAGVSRTLYVGMTRDLARRVDQHRSGLGDGFCARYRINRLVWFEAGGDVSTVIAREKQIKGWTRARKVALIEARNPAWQDLSRTWQFPAEPP